jgi:hypothetical protein
LLKNNAIPQGILKTDQAIRPEEADALERRWESKYGAARANRKIAVLGKGTEFKSLSFTPEVVKLFELKRWNLYTILAKYFLMAAGAAFFAPTGGVPTHSDEASKNFLNISLMKEPCRWKNIFRTILYKKSHLNTRLWLPPPDTTIWTQ